MPRRDYSKVAFAATGDTNVIPGTTQPDGSVSLPQGWGFDYQRDNGAGGGTPDPLAKNIDREDMNGILNEITASVGEMQQNGFPIWVASAAPYPLNAVVRQPSDEKNYRSTVTNNSVVPGAGPEWVELLVSGSETVAGTVRFATATQTNQGTSFSLAVSPGNLWGALSLSAPAVGDRLNVFGSLAAASPSATLTADALVVAASLIGRTYRLGSINKVINLGSVGVGGMDIGSSPANGWVGVYLAYNPNAVLSATNPMLIATNATSAAAPEVYGGANMPTGYTASALLAVLPTGGSGQFQPFILLGRYVSYFRTIINGVVTGFIPVSIPFAIPLNCKKIHCIAAMSSTGAAAGVMATGLCSTSAGPGTPGYGGVAGYVSAGVLAISGSYDPIPILTPQTIYASSSGPIAQSNIHSYGYDF